MIKILLPEYPTIDVECALWANGVLWIAGIDEAGRGALAGPVAAAAVILPNIKSIGKSFSGVRDSKKMTAAQRETWSKRIKSTAITYGVGLASAKEIDSLGILPATKLAAQRAIFYLSVVPDHLLIDHFRLPEENIPQTSISKGDTISLSIASASILAKTTRDEILCTIDTQYPDYGFVDHKGYGTKSHLNVLKALGPTPFHRKSFAPLNAKKG